MNKKLFKKIFYIACSLPLVASLTLGISSCGCKNQSDTPTPPTPISPTIKIKYSGDRDLPVVASYNSAGIDENNSFTAEMILNNQKNDNYKWVVKDQDNNDLKGKVWINQNNQIQWKAFDENSTDLPSMIKVHAESLTTKDYSDEIILSFSLTLPCDSTIYKINDGVVYGFTNEFLNNFNKYEKCSTMFFDQTIVGFSNRSFIAWGKDEEWSVIPKFIKNLKFSDSCPISEIPVTFKNCSSLTSIDLSKCNSLNYIEIEAFSNCSSLAYISLPSSLNYIGNNAFSLCPSIKKINIPNGGKYGIATNLGDTSKGQVVVQGNGTEYLWGSLTHNTGCLVWGEISLPNYSEDYFSYEAFPNCASLTSVDLSKWTNLTTFSSASFLNCISLISISLPNSIAKIDDVIYSTNYFSSSVRKISIANGGKYGIATNLGDTTKGQAIVEKNANGEYLWDKDTNPIVAKFAFGEIVIPDGVTSINNNEFSNYNCLTSIQFPSTLTSINDSAFYHCISLDSIDLSKCTSLNEIGFHAFSYCSSLTYISLPSSLNSIGNGAFGHCSSLTEITIPEKTNSIQMAAFLGCSSLTSVDLSKCTALNELGDGCFSDCSSLTYISLPSSLNSIGNGAFELCPLIEKINIPDGGKYGIATNLGDTSKGQTVVEKNENGKYLWSDAFPVVASLSWGEVKFSSDVTSIQRNAFQDCSSITSIDFSQCTNLNSIGVMSFLLCQSIKKITLPAGGKYGIATNLGDTTKGQAIVEKNANGEYLWDKDTNPIIGCLAYGEIVIPDGTENIGMLGIIGCSSITSISLPSSLNELDDTYGRSAFTYTISLNKIIWRDLDETGVKISTTPDYLFYDNYRQYTGKIISASDKYSSYELWEYFILNCGGTAAAYLGDWTWY